MSLNAQDTCLNPGLIVIAKNCCPMVVKYSSAVKSANPVPLFASAWTLDLVGAFKNCVESHDIINLEGRSHDVTLDCMTHGLF